MAPQPSSYAWWVDAQFHPFETRVRGIPVNNIRASWCKATEFRKDLFPTDLAADLDGNQASFSIDGYFDGSKIPQTALIGVYETCRGGPRLVSHDRGPAAGQAAGHSVPS